MSCTDAFAIFDTDGNGTLSYDELKAVLVRPGDSTALSEIELERIFMRYDLNYDGGISIQEFSQMWQAAGGAQPTVPRTTTTTAAAAFTASKKREAAAVPIATLEEQVTQLAALAAPRAHELKAVLTNVEAEMWPALDKEIEMFGLRLGSLSAGSGRSRGVAYGSIAPCSQLYEPHEGSGWYNGVVLLLLSPDVPADAVLALEKAMTSLLAVKNKSGRRCVHHVIAVPCGAAAEHVEAFFRRWPLPGIPFKLSPSFGGPLSHRECMSESRSHAQGAGRQGRRPSQALAMYRHARLPRAA